MVANAKAVSHWSDSSYNYTKTDNYTCYREAYTDFIDVPADGSLKFKDEIMDSIEPFDYNDFTGFNPSYLSGFLAEKYDLAENKVYIRAKQRMEKAVEDALRNSIKFSSVNVISKNININKDTIEYALLPVWMLNIMYKGERYTFAMNGQTKKMVGDVPIDWKKVLLRGAMCFTITFIISLIIYKLLGFTL